jgi:hypothetical protein
MDRPELLKASEDFDAFVKSFKEYKDALEKDGVFKTYTYANVNQLIKALLTTFKMHTAVVNSLTGVDINETEDLVHQKIGDTELIFPDNMRGKRIEEITSLISEGNNVIIKAGLGVLTKVRMIVAPISGNIIGLYYPGTKNIKIDPSAKATKSALKTILHEYGHKWYYEQLTQEGRDRIDAKYKEVFANMPTPEISPERAAQLTQYAKNIHSLVTTINVGDEVTYVGKSKKFKQASPFTVTANTGNALTITSHINQYYKLSGPAQSFINNGFAVNGKMLAVEYPKTNHAEISDGWFPTKYSEKDSHEWYSELFSYYLLGMLKDAEVIDFVKSTLK